MAERMLITKLVRTEQTRADLYAKGQAPENVTVLRQWVLTRQDSSG
jgi:hypothetical protein